MTSPIQLGKTYGVLHTESFFSFVGFAKKVGSDEIQKIDVFLDDKLIDTIEANEFIQKIDDMYDVENKAFTYNLPTQYIGKKAILSFKNHESGEELLNSPYTLIDKNHEKFNEASFFHKLYFEFDNKKIQNINPKDSIGFLATEDNILNKDLIKIINIFLEKNIDTRFKVFYFNNEQKKLISEKFNKYLSKIDFIIPKDIYDITNNTSIYIHSSTANEKSKSFGYWKTWGVLNQTKANMFLINIFEEIDDKEYSKSLKLLDNCKIEFEKSIVSKIFETDERYNEFKFINSINQPINDEIKNIYSPNSIGFLATKENLEDETFVGYIKELMESFPEIEFNGFGFTEDEKIFKSIFDKRINYYVPKKLNDLTINIEIYLLNGNKLHCDSIYTKIRTENIFVMYFSSKYQVMTVQEWDSLRDDLKNKLLDNMLKNNFLMPKNVNKFQSLSSLINYLASSYINVVELNYEMSMYRFYNFLMIEYIIKSKDFKNMLYRFLFK